MFDRAVLHIDLDAFFASVEQLRNSSLRGKPVIVGGNGSRAVVASCSYEARKFGIHAAMPMRMALQRCPDAVVVRGNMALYSKYSGMVSEIIAEEAPLFEKASIDEFYVDLTGMDRYVGCWKWATALRQLIVRETGLPLSQALATNKLVAKVGTNQAKPNGQRFIEAGTERQFLAPLSVRELPGVGRATYERLAQMGIKRVGRLAQMPRALLERRFGRRGLFLWRKANGLDDTPVQPRHERKSISTESTFAYDTHEVRWLRARLTEMVVKLAWELRRRAQHTALVCVKIRYADFRTCTHQRKIAHTAHDSTLISHVHELFEQLYRPKQQVRLLGVRFGELAYAHNQLELFADARISMQLLRQMDCIRERFGPNAIRLACTLPFGKKDL